MRTAFYAPLKSPNHAVVSGDRQIARLLMRALDLAGHEVEVVSELRAYMPDPDLGRLEALRADAADEAERLSALWREDARPELWVTYHPYYKSPDWLGPLLAERFGIPYVTVEASWSRRRGVGAAAVAQDQVVAAIRQAALNFCFTRRDRDGLAQVADPGRLAMLSPFIDVSPFRPGKGNGRRLATVAMMRPGDKLESYAVLAKALTHLSDEDWTLAIVGDGPCRDAVRDLFSAVAPNRIEWLGERSPAEVADILAGAGLYVWPGCGEAFGLAYLEAQASGLPVVAMETAGVPEVVRHGETGLLTTDGDAVAYAAAIRRLLTDGGERRRLGENARRSVVERHSLEAAAARFTGRFWQGGAR